MHQHLLRPRLPHVDDGQPLMVPGRDLAARPETRGPICSNWGNASGGGHDWPPLACRAGAAPAEAIAVRRDDRADTTAGVDWPAATDPSDCVSVPSRAGGS